MSVLVIGHGIVGRETIKLLKKFGHTIDAVDPIFNMDVGTHDVISSCYGMIRDEYHTIPSDFASTYSMIVYCTPLIDDLSGIIPILESGCRHIIIRSTISLKMALIIQSVCNPDTRLSYFPEFLEEGISPKYDRFVYGGECPFRDEFKAHYPEATMFNMSFIEAVCVKLGANNHLYSRIKAINDIRDQMMLQLGNYDGNFNYQKVHDAIFFDDRLGTKYNRHSIGIGGKCLPKDAHLGFLNPDTHVSPINDDYILKKLDIKAVNVLVIGITDKPEHFSSKHSPVYEWLSNEYNYGFKDINVGTIPNSAFDYDAIIITQEVAMGNFINLKDVPIIDFTGEYQNLFLSAGMEYYFAYEV